nr:hypothetical protein [Tanacetum cinerariifolium]
MKKEQKGKGEVQGSGPTWLFDIDTLTQSMNYQPVVAGNQPNSSIGIQENLTACTNGKEADSVQQYVLLPLWSSGSKVPQNTNSASIEVKEPESAVQVSPSNYDKITKHNDKTKREAKGKSLVELSTGVRDLSDDFEEFSDNSTNRVNADTGGKSSYVDPSQYTDDPDMPALEDITYSDDKEDVGVEADFSNLEANITGSPIPTSRVHKDHPVTQIIGDLSSAPQTRKEPKRVHQYLKDPSWIEAMQEELLQFKMQKEEGIDYEEVFAPVARIEAIRTIEEEVYVCQPPRFKDPDYLDKVYKVVKALYGLHQAPRACTPIDTEKPLLKDPDGEDVDVHTYRSMIGSLMYLTSSRLDIMFTVCACAHFQVTPKDSYLHAVKRIFRYLKGKPHLGLWYPKDSTFNLVANSNNDYAGACLDRKSTTGGCQS